MTRWWIATGLGGVFTALAVAVHYGLLNTLDWIVREWARPDDAWGTAQVRADLVVEGLRPAVLAVLLAALTVAYCLKRRSLRPATFVGGFCLATLGLTLATKAAVARPDPHGLIGGHGGSLPSGHMICVIVFPGLALLVARPRYRTWVWLIPALGGSVMATALLLQAAHWATDIFGGGLLATCVLAVATSPRWSRWGGARSRNSDA
jgi:membrane-associated phospholipid phosphatase